VERLAITFLSGVVNRHCLAQRLQVSRQADGGSNDSLQESQVSVYRLDLRADVSGPLGAVCQVLLPQVRFGWFAGFYLIAQRRVNESSLARLESRRKVS
jgi:hypothetical protein